MVSSVIAEAGTFAEETLFAIVVDGVLVENVLTA